MNLIGIVLNNRNILRQTSAVNKIYFDWLLNISDNFFCPLRQSKSFSLRKINTKGEVNFVNNEIIPGTNIKSEGFWTSFEKVVHELAPINKKLIQKREDIQKKIDEWHKKNKGIELNKKDFKDAIIKRLNGSGDLLRNKINFDQIDYSKDKTINRQLKKNT